MSWWLWVLVVLGVLVVAIWALGTWITWRDNHRALKAMTHVERLEFRRGRTVSLPTGHEYISAVDWLNGKRPADVRQAYTDAGRKVDEIALEKARRKDERRAE